MLGADAGLVDPLIEELLAQSSGLASSTSAMRFSRYTTSTPSSRSDLREGVMLRLGHREERDVVEQAAPQACSG